METVNSSLVTTEPVVEQKTVQKKRKYPKKKRKATEGENGKFT